MKTTLVIIRLSALFACMPLGAQEAPKPPAVPTAETRAKIEAQRKKIAALPVPSNLTRRTLNVGAVEREFFIHIPESCKGKAPVLFYTLERHGHGFPMQKGAAVADTGPKTRDISAPEEFWTSLKPHTLTTP